MVPQGNVKIIITKPHKSWIFLFFTLTFKYKRYKNGRPHFGIPIKNHIKYYVLWHFLFQNKKVDKFQLCLKTASSLFPFSCKIFLIMLSVIAPFGLALIKAYRGQLWKGKQNKNVAEKELKERACYSYKMRLCHPPDGSTSPKYKLLCFITTKKNLQREEHTSF